MKQQKGFSLVEVLVSLLMVTTLLVSLLQQQLQSKQLFTQLIFQEQDPLFFDEHLLANNKNSSLMFLFFPSDLDE